MLSGNRQESIINPRNAYGVSKTTEYHISNIANSNGVSIFYPILLNHESCFRQKKFFWHILYENLYMNYYHLPFLI